MSGATKEEFEVGDVVELRSGGQQMTVIEIAGDNVICEWFSKGGMLRKEQFSTTCLRQGQPPFSLNTLNQTSFGVSVGERQTKQTNLPTAPNDSESPA